MRQSEVLVAGALVGEVARVGTKRPAQCARGAVPVQNIPVKGITRRQIEATTKPPGDRRAIAGRAKMPHVHVHSWYKRVVRVQHQRHTDRAPRRTCKLRPLRGCGGRHACPRDIRKADAGLFEHRAVAQDARAAAATFRTRPDVLAKTCATVGRLQCGGNAVLQPAQPIRNDFEFRNHGHRQRAPQRVADDRMARMPHR